MYYWIMEMLAYLAWDKQIPLISHMFIKERSLNSGEGSIYPMFQVILHQYGSNMIFTAKHSGD